MTSFTTVAVLMALVVGCTLAQYSSVTKLCGSFPFSTASSKVYYQATIKDISEFEYRVISHDGQPLMMKEIYDFDEDDETGTNYDCFVESTTDDTACVNNYIASLPTFPARTVKFGFQSCGSTISRSENATIELWYRPTPSSDRTVVGSCASFQKATPTTFCNRNGASAAHMTIAAAVIVLAMLF